MSYLAPNNRLSTKKQWDNIWSGEHIRNLTFDPEQPTFSDLHNLFQMLLPKDKNFKFLEVGCYPGSYMWYFNKYFGYQVSGLEYVDWCCESTREKLQTVGIEGEVIHGDLFEYNPSSAKKLWDVVASFGFIEHFTDVVPVIKKHLDLLKPDGYLILVIPNHHGLNGRILKNVDTAKYKIHNLMSYDEMRQALKITGKARVISGGYFGRIGFWNTDLYPLLKKKGRLIYIPVRGILWMCERVGRILPNSAFLSPNIAMVAKKLE